MVDGEMVRLVRPGSWRLVAGAALDDDEREIYRRCSGPDIAVEAPTLEQVRAGVAAAERRVTEALAS